MNEEKRLDQVIGVQISLARTRVLNERLEEEATLFYLVEIIINSAQVFIASKYIYYIKPCLLHPAVLITSKYNYIIKIFNLFFYKKSSLLLNIQNILYKIYLLHQI